MDAVTVAVQWALAGGATASVPAPEAEDEKEDDAAVVATATVLAVGARAVESVVLEEDDALAATGASRARLLAPASVLLLEAAAAVAPAVPALHPAAALPALRPRCAASSIATVSERCFARAQPRAVLPDCQVEQRCGAHDG